MIIIQIGATTAKITQYLSTLEIWTNINVCRNLTKRKINEIHTDHCIKSFIMTILIEYLSITLPQIQIIQSHSYAENRNFCSTHLTCSASRFPT